MRKKIEREQLEDLLAEIQADAHAASSDGEVYLSPMIGETVDTESEWTSEGDLNDELST